jgi:GTP-binding protein Era
MHRPRTKLGDYMVKAAGDTLGGADAAILVVEPREAVGDIEQSLIDSIKKNGLPAILVVNKTDAVTPANVARTIAAYSAAYDFDAVVPTAAKSGKNIEIVLEECKRYLAESVWFFPDDIVTDQTERQIAAEIIREKILRTLSDEIPHGTAVAIEAFEELKNMVRIRAEIYCERASHKGIIIGKNGATLKRIGSLARAELEKFYGTKVFLDLWVKVKENWRDSGFNLNDLGYRADEL